VLALNLVSYTLVLAFSNSCFFLLLLFIAHLSSFKFVKIRRKTKNSINANLIALLRHL
jgi:hypothetical protein